MPTIEEILRELEASDVESGEAVEDKHDAGDNENATIRAIRESQKEWEKRAKELAKEVRTLRTQAETAAEESRKATALGVFKELELPEKQAELYLKTVEGDVTADSIRQFVTDFGLKDLSADTGGTTEDKSQGFEPGGTGGAPPKADLISTVELAQIMATDPARASQLVAEGKVEKADWSTLYAPAPSKS